MNTISSASYLQPLLFAPDDVSSCFFSRPTERELGFMSYWNTLVTMAPYEVTRDRKPPNGRPGHPLSSILAVWAVKEFFSLKTITSTMELIRSSTTIRTICSLDVVPSAASVSRRTAELEEAMDIDGMHAALCSAFYGNRLVCNLSIDSTIIGCREKPVVKERRKPTGRRGPKKKGSEEAKSIAEAERRTTELHELEENGDIQEYIGTLCSKCSLTGKRNSKGHMQWSIGYKAHLAVDDFGIPVASVVTGACVHDSKVAIPLVRIADSRCTFLYALMDGGYSDKRIAGFISSMEKVPVIDFKAARNGMKPEMDAAKKTRYRARTTVERTNSELKANFLPHELYSRGKRAIFEIKLAVLLTTIRKMAAVLKAEGCIPQAA